MDALDTIRQIENDFEHRRPPFDDVIFPERRLLNELDPVTKEGTCAAISLFSTLDYNRDANQLVDKIIEAHELENSYNVFNPHEVAASEQTAKQVFAEVPFRYKERDAHAWYENCSRIVEYYNGKWSELLLDVGCDAERLVKRLHDEDFLCLKGDKIAPMYARIIDDEVCDLHNVWSLDIPVDTHIRRLSRDLFDSPDMEDDTIRAEWRSIAIETGISRHIVDGALWHIGNNWDEWGKQYWDEVAE